MHRDGAEPDKDEEPVDAGGDEGESAEPHEVAMAREAVHLLLAEQQKTAALKVREGPRAFTVLGVVGQPFADLSPFRGVTALQLTRCFHCALRPPPILVLASGWDTARGKPHQAALRPRRAFPVW